MANRFGTNSPIYDLSRLMTFAVGVPAQNVFSAPIILDNPSITSGIALFSHTTQPWSVAVAAASELDLIDLNFVNTGAAGTKLYALRIDSSYSTADTGASIAMFGQRDFVYIGVESLDGAFSPTAPAIRIYDADTTSHLMQILAGGEAQFNKVKISDNQIEEFSTNGVASLDVNYNGYAGGTTQFRDTKIFDGKQGAVAFFTGTYKNLLFGTTTDKATGSPHLFIAEDATLSLASSGATRTLMVAENAWHDGANWKRLTAKNTASLILLGTDSFELYYQTDANNTVDSTITFSRYYQFGKTLIGFFGGGNSLKATVTGYSGGNPALVSLLSGLSGYGFITDSSSAGRPHGSCYGNEIAWTQASAAQNTWYIISDADMSDGHAGFTAVTHDGSGKLTVAVAGDYDVELVASIECSALNKHVQIAIALNGTPVDVTPHYEVSSPSAQLELTAIAQVAMTANQYIEAAIRTTDTGTPDLSVDHLAIKLTMIE